MDQAFPLSLAHGSLLHLTPPDLVRVAAATGYDTVGIRVVPMARLGEPFRTLADEPGLLRETRRALADTGVGVLDAEVLQIRDDRAPRVYLPALEVAAGLGARFVLANVYTPDPVAADEGFAALCDLAGGLGLTVALEFVSFSDVVTLAQAVGFARRCGRDDVAVLVDMLHLHSSGEAVAALADAPRRLLRYVHVCDAPRDVPPDVEGRRRIAREGRLMPGDGGVDIAGMLRHLPRDVVYAVEVQNPGRSRALGAEAFARLAREATIRCLERHRRESGAS